MTEIISESGMRFVAEQTFHIEKSDAYANVGEGVKTVEFIRRKNNMLFFVEAKTTYPNKESNGERFGAESAAVMDKFIHSLNLLASVSLGLRSDDISMLKNQADEATEITFLLVISEHETSWCKNVKVKLQEIINQDIPFCRIWRPKVLVINSDHAVRQGHAL